MKSSMRSAARAWSQSAPTAAVQSALLMLNQVFSRCRQAGLSQRAGSLGDEHPADGGRVPAPAAG